MSGQPLVGLVACTRTVGDERVQAVIERYLDAAQVHARCTVLIVPGGQGARDMAVLAQRLDGLLLTGSPSNLPPMRYGEEGEGDGPFDPVRDATSLPLIAAMLEAGKPVFGICRGFQEINVVFGGTLVRDVSAAGRTLAHHAPPGTPFAEQFAHSHGVELVPGGVLQRWLAKDYLTVNSVHFQGVGQLGDGLSVEARAPDGLIEAVSACPGGAPLLAVQWHPEWRTDANPDSQSFYRLFGEALRGQRAPWRAGSTDHATA